MPRYLGPLRKKLRTRGEKKITASGIHKGKKRRIWKIRKDQPSNENKSG